jgi:hypothetical protein
VGGWSATRVELERQGGCWPSRQSEADVSRNMGRRFGADMSGGHGETYQYVRVGDRVNAGEGELCVCVCVDAPRLGVSSAGEVEGVAAVRASKLAGAGRDGVLMYCGQRRH